MNFELPQGTPEGQRDAVNADEKVITVSAGAGTGKTWVLSGRYARLLAGEISPSEILTLTYTEAAAADMKKRILERIKKDLAEYDESKLSDSWISTIHSFAGRLIRESGLSIDIDPAATVITPQQEQEFWESIRSAAEFANLKQLARTYGSKELNDAAKSLDEDVFMTNAVNKWHSDKLSDFARASAELHASSGHSWKEMLIWSEQDAELLINNTREKIKKFLEPEWRKVWDEFQKINLPESDSKSQYAVNLKDLLSWQKKHQPGNYDELKFFYNSIVIDEEKKITGRGYHNAQAFKDLGEILGMSFSEWRKSKSGTLREISASFGKDFSDEELWMRRTLLKFCAVSWGIWDMMKKRRGLLSFSDMILHAGNAVKKNVKNKFTHIMVDEFQDTDRQQFNMINSLKRPEACLFAVGDPKQSIYKFRNAAPEIFLRKYKTYPEFDNCERIDLSKNFRSRKQVVDAVNSIFRKIMTEDAMEISYNKDAELNFGAIEEYPDAENTFTDKAEFLIVASESSKKKNSDSNSLDDSESLDALSKEVQLIADKINSMIDSGKKVWDRDKKIYRPKI